MEENGCVSYRGGNQDFVMGNSKMSFDELSQEIGSCIGIEYGTIPYTVKMRFPDSGSFKVVSLTND
ncbi:hypothetical protein, partial [Klebsiella variicola]|uniref:hypothetical protein n=1 Tax=Klebsiella variicola TaxID=244366 RepID=UPI00272FC428